MIMPDPQAQGISCIVPDVTSCSDHDSDQPPEVTGGASLPAISAPSLSASHGRGDDGMLIHNSPDNCQIVSTLSLNTREELENDPTKCFIGELF